MDLYRKVDTNLNFASREKEVETFWAENNIAQKAIDQREGCKNYTFYDGPPTANGQPHVGHVLTRVIKDLFPRYHSMKGEKVLRKAGWDTHGLPVELEVEKLIGINGKDQIEAYGIEPFIKKCRESVWKYKAMWEEFSGVVGFWADMEHPYITYENYYIESEWWALKEIWEKGLLYKGHKVVPYCPRCGTPLSSHEVSLGYKDLKERSAIVKFKALDDDAYYLAWTTTPWTLPSNLVLCVNPKVDYVKIQVGNTKYILAEALLPNVFPNSIIDSTINNTSIAGLDIRRVENGANGNGNGNGGGLDIRRFGNGVNGNVGGDIRGNGNGNDANSDIRRFGNDGNAGSAGINANSDIRRFGNGANAGSAEINANSDIRQVENGANGNGNGNGGGLDIRRFGNDGNAGSAGINANSDIRQFENGRNGGGDISENVNAGSDIRRVENGANGNGNGNSDGLDIRRFGSDENAGSAGDVRGNVNGNSDGLDIRRFGNGGNANSAGINANSDIRRFGNGRNGGGDISGNVNGGSDIRRVENSGNSNNGGLDIRRFGNDGNTGSDISGNENANLDIRQVENGANGNTGSDISGNENANLDIRRVENDETTISAGNAEQPHITILARFKGADLEFKHYVPLYPFANDIVAKSGKPAFIVTCDDYVTTDDGTGIVHCAPAFGEDDNRVCKRYGTPFVQFVDGKGNMTSDTYWAGTFVKDADPLILDDLKRSGKLFRAPVFEHSYPHCWRCDTPLIYYARESWFIKMTAVKDALLKNNATINWIPPTIGTGRFGDWLEHVQDWGISRNRYWGTPLNIWECDCGHQHSIGSIAELRELSTNCPPDIELHRPYIDAVTFPCPTCGHDMHRVPEVIDCWFDSGAMPFAQWHYPFENQQTFHTHFPANFISEAVDQTRGWFYSLLAISTLLFDKPSFENCIVLGLVLDKDGQKMSKSKGNAVAPMDMLKKHGADAIRWYFYENSAPWLPNRFHDDAIIEGQRKFLGTLWNTYAFFVLYANIDNFDATKYQLDYNSLGVMDKWCLSRLNTMVKTVDECLANYKVPETAKALQSFIDELSNWYVRRCRSRFWAKGLEPDKINAYLTLYTALVTFAKCAAPMVPFITENIYRNLVCSIDNAAPESVHLCDFPTANDAFIDADLERNMDAVLKIVVLGRAARNAASIKNRQPLAALVVSGKWQVVSEFFVEIIRDELNVKSVEFRDNMDEFVKYTIKPNFRVLGKRLGKHMGAVQAALKSLNAANAKAELDTTGALQIGDFTLTPDDIAITATHTDGYNIQRDADISIALSTTLTPALIEEGYVRELISKIQTMRRESNFAVTDRIRIFASGNAKLADIITRHSTEIQRVTLADSITFAHAATARSWDINGESIRLGVSKI